MDDLFIYLVRMPDDLPEAVLPCDGGYTIYLDDRLTQEGLIKEYHHALEHIKNGDFWDETLTVSQKEFRAHGYK